MSKTQYRQTLSPPSATLRLQLHAGYTFDDARTDLPYFRRLGVSHLYLSPVTQARAGSTHGYDVVDHQSVDHERGGEAALRRLAVEARRAGLGLLLDIVPNHMAADPANAWWWDVLKQGAASPWAGWFDIDWEAPRLCGKVLAPFLGQAYAAALRAGEIRLDFNKELGLHVVAQGRPWPLAAESLSGLQGDWNPGSSQHPAALKHLLTEHDPLRPQGRRRLHQLLLRQHYQLACWQEAARHINWRRFFEVNELIGVCVERADVFQAVHALPLRLYAEGLIDGLRIDHVDGLAQPLAYCERLRAAMRAAGAQRPVAPAADPPWLVVEKILAPGETLDARWAVSGTTGYDFAADVGALLHDATGERPLFKAWAGLSHDRRPPSAWLTQARQEMLNRHFIVERGRLLDALTALIPAPRAVLGKALDALLRHYPTYRSYVEGAGRALPDQRWFGRALQQAAIDLAGDTAALKLLPALDQQLGGRPPQSSQARRAVQCFQQLTPPLAAKSLEDTVFYRYGCLLSRNEVGSDPSEFSLPVQAFHKRNRVRAAGAPYSLLATATHDHKRGEDTRARLAVLSEIPHEWLQICRPWLDDPSPGADRSARAAFHYMLLQTVVGAWPPGLSAADAAGVQAFLDRLGAWLLKAMREGKQLSSWTQPDVEEEALWLSYLASLAPGQPRHAVLSAVEALVLRLEPGAIANGLIQTALRISCPGIPDLYQGTEWRDFSLVDPDNRRPVDFQARARSLEQAWGGQNGDPQGCRPLAVGRWPAQAWVDGRVKQALIAALLSLRSACPEAFSGDYAVLRPEGGGTGQLLAFSRGEEVVVLAGVKCAARLRFDAKGVPALPAGSWGDSTLELPGHHPGWRDVLRGTVVPASQGRLRVADLLAGLPLAVLQRDQG